MTSPLPPNALRFRTSSRARSKLRWVVLGLAAALVFDVLVAPWLAGSATDWLWFREIHFESVFVTSLVAHTVLFVVAALVAYGFLYANLSVARRGIVGVPTPFLNRNGEAIDLTRFIPRVLQLGALFVAFVAGVVAAGLPISTSKPSRATTPGAWPLASWTPTRSDGSWTIPTARSPTPPPGCSRTRGRRASPRRR